MRNLFVPKLWTSLQNYSLAQCRADIIAGVIVGIVALPLAIAFAIASGVSPDKGLVTAVVAGFLISVLGGSRVQIGGPTGAFVVIVYGIVQQHGLEGLICATFMGGLILLIFGFAGLGGVIKFIPYPVTVGFTTGIALIIFSSQVKDFLGLTMGTVSPHFIEKWMQYFEHIGSLNFYALAISAGTLLIIWLWGKIVKTIPGSLIALIVTTAAGYFLKLPVETIGSRFGSIPTSLPIPMLPSLSLAMIRDLIPAAFTIAILAGIESLLSAVVADGMIGGRHRSNMELVAQGIANIASSLFGGMPATGAIARTATNVHNGGRTPVSGIVHALTLYLIMIFFGRYAVLIPMACLAGILVVVAYRMSEWHSFNMILKSPHSDVAVLLITFGLTVIIDLTVAIEIGMVMAAFLLIRRLSLSSAVSMKNDLKDIEEARDPEAIGLRHIPQGVEVFEIQGPFFFGIATTFLEIMKNIQKKPKIRILRMRHVPSIDATALHAMKQVVHFCQSEGIVLLLSGVQVQPLRALKHSGLMHQIGEANHFENIDKALAHAAGLLGSSPSQQSS